jgi:phenylalanyl-tRNA synthetase beta chain
VRISLAHLRRYCPALPADPAAARDLLDDVGVEVKRVEESALGPLFVLELLANRGDHRCYAGVAREVVGRLGGGVELPERAVLELGVGAVAVTLETELCSVYTATVVELDPAGGALPPAVLVPLAAAGIKSGLAAVDASNLVNLELGQPAHFFDADAIAGGIVVRLSRAGERAWPLFEPAAVTLPAGTLVVADEEEKILGIAGVIGCEESKTTAATRRAVLETAAFDPVAVRVASRALRISTDASARFERGPDPTLPPVGAGRVVYLLETHAGARRAGPTLVAGDWRDPHRTIPLDLDRLAAHFLRPFAAGEVRERLARYGFSFAGAAGAGDGDGAAAARRLRVVVPPHRLWDVENPEDLYEEVARSVGYDELPIELPAVSSGILPTPRQRAKERVEEVLLGMGFYEVVTDAFYDRKMPERLGLPEVHPLSRHVETVNALDSSFSLLKNNCLAQAVAAVADNLRFGTEDLKLYEWTRTFHPDPAAANGVCSERRMLWLIAHGRAAAGWAAPPRPADVWYLEGIVEELAAELRLPLTVGRPRPDAPLSLCLHPYRQGTVLLGGEEVGIFGEVAPALLRSFRVKRGRPCYLELDAEALRLEEGTPEFTLPPPRPPSVRMLAFTLPQRVAAGEVVRVLERYGPFWLAEVSIVDSYAHEEAGRPVRTVTFALAYRNDQTEHSVEELNQVTAALVAAVEGSLGERGVHLRAGD